MAGIGIIWPAISDVEKLTVEAEQEFVFYDMHSILSDKVSIGDCDNETSFNISNGKLVIVSLMLWVLYILIQNYLSQIRKQHFSMKWENK